MTSRLTAHLSTHSFFDSGSDSSTQNGPGIFPSPLVEEIGRVRSSDTTPTPLGPLPALSVARVNAADLGSWTTHATFPAPPDTLLRASFGLTLGMELRAAPSCLTP